MPNGQTRILPLSLKIVSVCALAVLGIAGAARPEIPVTWYSGAGQVSGSLAVVRAADVRIALDCGALYPAEGDERDDPGSQAEQPLPADAVNSDALLLTHAHLDHSGRLPQLVRAGYRHPVYATPATRALLPVMLGMAIRYGAESRDWYWSAKSVNTGKKGTYVTAHWRPDCPWGMKISAFNRQQRQGSREVVSDTESIELRPCDSCKEIVLAEILRLVQVRAPGQAFPLPGGLSATFLDAGHVPGAASVLLTVPVAGKTERLLFSGDLGNDLSPLERSPEPAPPADRVWLESTYGGETRPKDAAAELERFRREVAEAVGNRELVWIPAFALDRTQRVLFELGRARAEGKLPTEVPIYCPSPSAGAISEIYREELARPSSPPWFRPELYKLGPPAFPQVIRKIPGTLPRPSILVTTSGMMDEAFSASLLDQLLPFETTRVLLVGWADPRTPAGQLAAGKTTVTRQSRDGRDKEPPRSIGVRATVSRYRVFSAHADMADSLRWLSRQDKLTPVMLVHGEPVQLASRQAALIAAGFLHVGIEKSAAEEGPAASGVKNPGTLPKNSGGTASGSSPSGSPSAPLPAPDRKEGPMAAGDGLQVLTLAAVVEGPVTSKKGNVRLTCRLESGETVVFWGKAGSDTRNIDRIRPARFPLRVRCRCVPPSAGAARYGHRWWVPESSPLEILP